MSELKVHVDVAATALTHVMAWLLSECRQFLM